jgi:YidC/Oxa1 family membrane protein insertase
LESDNRRVLIAAVISMAIIFLWQTVFSPARRQGGEPPGAKTAEAPAKTPQAAPPVAAAPVPAAAVPENAPEETVSIESPDFRATFSTWGGALKSVSLKNPKFQREENGRVEPVNLVRVGPREAYPLSVAPSPELGGAADLASDPAPRAPMRLVAHDARSVAFEGRVGSVNVRKRFELGERPYELKGTISVFGAEKTGAVAVLFPSFMPPDAPKPGFLSSGQVFESVVPVCRAGDKTQRFNGKEAVERVAGTVSWVGLDERYFVAALVPGKPGGECLFARGPAPGEALAALRVPVEGGAAALDFQLFAGPKRLDLLRAYGRDLDTAIDYGSITNFFAFFARILLFVMRWFHEIVRNWGLAIILLTLAVKLILYPLTVKQMQSMNEMRKLQPEIEKLKAKYGDDKEKLNQAVMQLYQQHKVNPLGGCLPMLVQLPIWFALYATLQTSVELYREPFLWIRDLTQHDPIYVLPLLMGVSMFVTQKISPQPADSTQAKMMLYFMPIFFTFIMLKLPAGLTLYIFVNNLLSIAQQQWLMRRQAEAAPART